MRLFLVFSVVFIANCVNGKYVNQGSKYSSKSSSIEYYTKPGRHITIPVFFHIDRVLTNRLMKEYNVKTVKKLEGIPRSILKEVELYYRHLNHNISFSLKGIRFIKNNLLSLDDNASTYLKKYCTWQGKRKAKKHEWWFSILLTGLDLFYLNKEGREVRTATGRGYAGGICAINKSCTIVEWNPKNMGYLVAHEIGHSLGINHDHPYYNTCRPNVHIMSSKYNPAHHPKTWSHCSRRDLHRFLLGRKSWCLRNVA